MVDADDVNILARSVCAVKKNTEAFLIGSKESGLEVNADKTKCTVMSRDQNPGRSHNIKIGNSSFKGVVEFRYLGTTLTNQNSLQEEIKSRLKSGNACCHSVHSLLSSSLLSKNIKIKIHRTLIFPVLLFGRRTWSLTLREERRIRVFENRVLSTIFGSKRDEVTREYRKLHNEELTDLYSSSNIIWMMKSRRMK